MNKRRLTYDDFWFRYIYPKNLNLFGCEKLVAPEISLGGNFSYDINGRYYSTTTIYGWIKKDDITISYKALMAILNSHLVWWFLKNTGTVLANGYYRYKPAYLKPFPMANFSSTSLKYLEETVDKLTADSLSEKDKNILTNRTNDIIYKEYSLSDDEIAYIESTI